MREDGPRVGTGECVAGSSEHRFLGNAVLAHRIVHIPFLIGPCCFGTALTRPDRGEQQAAAMEANLTKLEDKLDALLAQFEATEEAAGIEPFSGEHSVTKPKDAKGNR